MPIDSDFRCHVCGHAEGIRHRVREMMFGTGEEFSYWECAACGCLQLTNPPSDLARHYPTDTYCSFNTALEAAPGRVELRRGWLRRWLWQERNAAVCFGRPGLFAWLARWRPNPMATHFRTWLRHTHVNSFTARIADLGCGKGTTLRELALLGFTSLLGVDPFLPEDRAFGPVRLIAQPIETLVGQSFDLLMLHHSLEHMPDQHAVFRLIRKLISVGGVCLIRIPLASQGPWRRYGTDWVELDAPRHFFLHTEQSLQRLASANGLRVQHIEYEAEPFSYAVSELYRRGVTYFDSQTGRYRDWRTLFSPVEVIDFERLATDDRVPDRAGRAAFYLSAAPLPAAI